MEASSPHDRVWFIDRVREHQARLRASIRALGARAESVDDIAQEALALAWEKRAQFDSGGDFGAWVMQIARRLIANERRKEARQSRILAGEVTDRLLQRTPEAEAPTARLEREEELTALQHCLGELPSHYREMIQWRYAEQLSPGGIGGRLGRTSNAVRQTLLRLRRLLLECMERRLGGELVPRRSP